MEKESEGEEGCRAVLTSTSSLRSAQLDTYAELWAASELCDVSLSAEGRSLSAHRVVVAGGSEYLRARFKWEGLEPIVAIEGVSFDSLKAILDYIYRGRCTVTQSSLVPLMHAASAMDRTPLSHSRL